MYKSHLEYVKNDVYLWVNCIKASGIVFFAKPGIRESVIGVPIAFLYPLVLTKTKLKDKSVLFSSILLIFSIVLGFSYLFWETGISPRFLVLFSISSALLFPFFIDYLKSTFGKFFRNPNRILKIILILLLINRLLIISFAFPGIEATLNVPNETKMVLWIDDNIPIDSNIIIQKNFNSDMDENLVFIKRVLCPREIIFFWGGGGDDYTINKNTYYLCYDDSLPEGDIVHKEKSIVLVKLRDNKLK